MSRPDGLRSTWRRAPHTGLRTVALAAALAPCAMGLGAVEQGDTPRVTASRVSVLPTVDAHLDEGVWSRVAWVGGFTQTRPVEGRAATFDTRFAVAYSDADLFVAIVARDPEPENISLRLDRRDADSRTDWVSVAVDGNLDRRTARFFAVSAAGVQRDGILVDGAADNTAWDGAFESATRVTDDGWVAELRIPLALVVPGDVTEIEGWGIQVRRFVSRLAEDTHWAPVGALERAYVGQFGLLVGLEPSGPTHSALVSPWVSLTGQVDPEAIEAGAAPQVLAGVDLQYSVGAPFTAALTVLPSFQQVAVDPAFINLTAFEVWQQERRPFFLEGGEIFDHPGAARFFYSRRVGAPPPGYGAIGGVEGVVAVVEDPATVPVLAATKLIGRTHRGLSYGVLDAVTGPTHAAALAGDGTPTRLQTAPAVHYGVLRVRKDDAQNSYLGALVTTANPVNASVGRSGAAYYAGDELGLSSAYGAAVDFQKTSASGQWRTTGLVGGSLLPASGGASTVGLTSSLGLSRDSGQRHVGSASYNITTGGFDVSALGFAPRRNEHGLYTEQTIRLPGGRGPFKQIESSNQGWSMFLIDPALLHNVGFNGGVSGQLYTLTTLGIGGGAGGGGYDPYEPRVAGRVYQRPQMGWLWGAVSTDNSRPAAVSVAGSWKRSTVGEQWADLKPALELHLGDRLTFMASPVLLWAAGERAWIATLDAAGGDDLDIVFGSRDLWRVDLQTRGTWSPAPSLSLQFFAQWLRLEGEVTDQFLLDQSGALTASPAPLTDASTFGERRVVTNAILRWSPRPQWELFGVWSHRGAGVFGGRAPGAAGWQSVWSGSDDTLALQLRYQWSGQLDGI